MMKKIMFLLLFILILIFSIPTSAESQYNGVTAFEMIIRYRQRLEDFGYKNLSEPTTLDDGTILFNNLQILSFDPDTYSVLQCVHSKKKDSSLDYFANAIFESALCVSFLEEKTESTLHKNYINDAYETYQKMYLSNESEPYDCGDYYITHTEDAEYVYFTAYRKDVFADTLRTNDLTFTIAPPQPVEASYPLSSDAKIISTAINELNEDGVILTNTNSELSKQDDGTITATYRINNGMDLSVSYRDGVLLSYMATIDPGNAYAKNSIGYVFSAILSSVIPDLDNSGSMDILSYLAGNLNDDELKDLGTSANLDKSGFNIKLVKTKFAVILGLYPIDY